MVKLGLLALLVGCSAATADPIRRTDTGAPDWCGSCSGPGQVLHTDPATAKGCWDCFVENGDFDLVITPGVTTNTPSEPEVKPSSSLVPVLYACVRVLLPAPLADCDPRGGYMTNESGTYCIKRIDRTEARAEHEFRTSLEKPFPSGCLTDAIHRPGECERGFTDGDWQCKPVVEFEGKP